MLNIACTGNNLQYMYKHSKDHLFGVIDVITIFYKLFLVECASLLCDNLFLHKLLS